MAGTGIGERLSSASDWVLVITSLIDTGRTELYHSGRVTASEAKTKDRRTRQQQYRVQNRTPLWGNRGRQCQSWCVAAQPRALAPPAPSHGTTATATMKDEPPLPPHRIRVLSASAPANGNNISISKERRAAHPRKKQAKRRAPPASRRRHWTCAACPSTDVAQRPPAELHTRGAEGFFFFSPSEGSPRRDAGEEAVCPFGAWRLAPCPQSMIALHNK